MGGKYHFFMFTLVVGCIAVTASCGKLQNGSSSGSLSDLLSGISGTSNSDSGSIQLIFSNSVPDGIQIKLDSVTITSAIAEDRHLTITGVSEGPHQLEVSAPGYLSYSIAHLEVEKNKTATSGLIDLRPTSVNQPTRQVMQLSLLTDSKLSYIGFYEPKNSIAEYKTQTQKSPAISGIFIPMIWRGEKVKFSQHVATLQNMRQNNAVPLITWEPWDPGGDRSTNILPDIAAGKYDDEITEWAVGLRELNYPVIIRWGHEMQGDWYPWSNNPAAYRQAYQHIVTIFKNQEANQVLWMFAPNHNDGGTGRNFEDYFPGRRYVDLLGISGYNFGTTQPSWNSTWQSFDAIFGNMVDALTNDYHLPIVLDVACTEEGGNKANWISDMGWQLNEHKYDAVKGIMWFQEDKSNQGETNWRFDSSQTALAAFNSLVSLPRFVEAPTLRPVSVQNSIN